MSVSDLKKVFGKAHCEYFPDYRAAVEAFERDVLTDSQIRTNHEEIAQLQLGKRSISKDWVESYRTVFDATNEIVMAKLDGHE